MSRPGPMQGSLPVRRDRGGKARDLGAKAAGNRFLWRAALLYLISLSLGLIVLQSAPVHIVGTGVILMGALIMLIGAEGGKGARAQSWTALFLDMAGVLVGMGLASWSLMGKQSGLGTAVTGLLLASALVSAERANERRKGKTHG